MIAEDRHLNLMMKLEHRGVGDHARFQEPPDQLVQVSLSDQLVEVSLPDQLVEVKLPQTSQLLNKRQLTDANLVS